MAVYSRPLSSWSRRSHSATTSSRNGLLLTLACVAALMSLLFLFQVGRVSTQGYQFEQLQLQRTELERAKEQLVFEIARSQSLDVVRSRALALGMQPLQSTQTRYVSIVVPASRWTAQAR